MLETLTRPARRTLARLGNAGRLCGEDAAFEGVWDALDPALPFPSPLAEGGHPAVVRFARALPVPEPLPALHLLAIRVADHDLLLVSVARGPVGAAIPLPVRSVRGATFSTLWPVGLGIPGPVVAEVHGPGPGTLGALRDATHADLEVQLFLATGGHFGRVRLGARLRSAVA